MLPATAAARDPGHTVYAALHPHLPGVYGLDLAGGVRRAAAQHRLHAARLPARRRWRAGARGCSRHAAHAGDKVLHLSATHAGLSGAGGGGRAADAHGANALLHLRAAANPGYALHHAAGLSAIQCSHLPDAERRATLRRSRRYVRRLHAAVPGGRPHFGDAVHPPGLLPDAGVCLPAPTGRSLYAVRRVTRLKAGCPVGGRAESFARQRRAAGERDEFSFRDVAAHRRHAAIGPGDDVFRRHIL